MKNDQRRRHRRDNLDRERQYDARRPSRHATTEPRSQRNAQQKLRLWLLKHHIVRGPCAMADDTCLGPMDPHHDDYEKPLEFVFLCRSHHKRLHGGSA